MRGSHDAWRVKLGADPAAFPSSRNLSSDTTKLTLTVATGRTLGSALPSSHIVGGRQCNNTPYKSSIVMVNVLRERERSCVGAYLSASSVFQ